VTATRLTLAATGSGPPLAGGAEQGGFARWWTELVADLADVMPGGVAGLAVVLLAVAGLVVLALYWRRSWWPRRRRREKVEPLVVPEPAEAAADDELPEVPAATLLSLADRYAAEGRYAEAVRERLRAIVRELVDRGVIEHRPGWTVTELAAGAGRALPPAAGPLAEAARVFSGIWYGDRPARAVDDTRMRDLATALGTTLAGAPA
jgi:hypothetical protein